MWMWMRSSWQRQLPSDVWMAMMPYARIELSADWVLRSELGSDARSLPFLCSCVHDV